MPDPKIQTPQPETGAEPVRPDAAAADPEPKPTEASCAGAGSDPQPTAQVIDLDGVRAEERRATLAYVSEVHEVCALAGRGDLAAGFIARATAVADVRRALLDARAADDEATTIRSQVRMPAVDTAQPAIDTAAIYAARNQNVR